MPSRAGACVLSSSGVNRSDLQKLANVRIDDAGILLTAGRYEAAYYLLGYAVECALKACISKQIREFDFPDKKLVNESYVHDLTKLLNICGIKHLHEPRCLRTGHSLPTRVS